MIHQEWTGKLDAYLDGELPDSDMRQLDAHLRGCSECAAESLRRLQWKRSIHSAGQRFVADPGFRERVVKNLGRKEKGRGWFAWWPAFALAAVAIALLVGVIAVQQNARRARNDQIFSELADLHVSP